VSAGYFLTFEGPEGSGKSTQIKLLSTALEAAGHRVFVTREPGGTQIGEAIRAILLDHDNYAMLPETEALLHTAARSQHVGEAIRPALENGMVALCDRYVDSTLAYQGGGRGLAMESLEQIQELATGGLRPDLTILLDLAVEVGLARRFGSEDEVNRFDSAGVAFHQRVRLAFLELSRRAPERWAVIDAARSIDEVAADVLSVVATRTSLLANRDSLSTAPSEL
jgi:dTMP kinase